MWPPVALLVDRTEGIVAVDLGNLEPIGGQAPGERFTLGAAPGGWNVLNEDALAAALQARAPKQISSEQLGWESVEIC